MSADIIRAPWTEDQVASLNAYQKCRAYHPYTCGAEGCHDPVRSHSSGVLRATRDGWVCDICEKWHQDWAHKFTTDWSWRDTINNLIELDPMIKTIYKDGC